MNKDEAIKFFETDPAKRDGVYNLAKALGVRTQVVYAWRRVPSYRQLQIQSLSGGKLKVDDDVVLDPSEREPISEYKTPLTTELASKLP